MLWQEFVDLTGVEPTDMEYSLIEEIYYDFEGDKQQFCEKFLAVKDPLLQISRMVASKLKSDLEKAEKAAEEAQEEIEGLKKRLEAEQEWKPYEDKNLSDERYDELARTDADELTDEQAVELIAKEFGFRPEIIRIVRKVPRYEINRHHQLRERGTKNRRPRFSAWDWNYIRFDVYATSTMSYEMVDGALRLYR